MLGGSTANLLLKVNVSNLKKTELAAGQTQTLQKVFLSGTLDVGLGPLEASSWKKGMESPSKKPRQNVAG